MVQNRGLEEAWAALGAYRGVLVVSWGLLGAFWGVLGTSWGVLGGVLGVSWGVPGVSWGALRRLLGPPRTSWDVLGASWAVFVTSWGRPENVLERLGSLLGHLGGDFIGIKQYFRGMSSWKPFFIRILMVFVSKNQVQKLKKSLNSNGKIVFLALRLF